LVLTVPVGDLTILVDHLQLVQPHQSFKTQTFTSFNVTTKSSLNFSYILTAPFSSWLDTMMIHHQMSLRAAIGNASALYMTRIHEYMSDVESCFSKINWRVWQKCVGTQVIYSMNGSFGRWISCAVARRQSASLRMVNMRSDTILPKYQLRRWGNRIAAVSCRLRVRARPFPQRQPSNQSPCFLLASYEVSS
jgi:hypothetical protein